MKRWIKNQKGQFVIIAALIIAALTLATVISIHEININSQSISYKPVNEFLLGTTSDMNRALTVALAKYTDYIQAHPNEPNPEENAEPIASDFMRTWKQSLLTSYSSYGIKIRPDSQNMIPIFRPPNWIENDVSSSFAYMPYAFDVDSYGFMGWTGTTAKYVQLQITSVTVESWWAGPAFVEFQLYQSDTSINDLRPISDLPTKPSEDKFRIGTYNADTGVRDPQWEDPTVTYLGNGNYRVTLSNPVDRDRAVNPIRKGVYLELATPNDGIWIQNFYSEPKAQSSSTTLLSSLVPITFGQTITDTATVTGLGEGFPNPTGQIQFEYSTDAGQNWYPVGVNPIKTLTPESTAISDVYYPRPGEYRFRAIYFGDMNYEPSQSGDDEELLTVNKYTPTVSTILSQTIITLGGNPSSVTDQVNIDVINVETGFPLPTGIVNFQVKFEAGEWSTFSTTTLNTAEKTTESYISLTSDEYTPLNAGNYHFRAVYLGDTNYNSAQSGDAEEPLTVNKATPRVITTLSPPAILLGGSVTDSATVIGLGGIYPDPTGTFTFEVSTDNGISWSAFTSDRNIIDGSATSDSYTTDPSTVTYYFRAVYSGDSNYNSAASGNTDEPLTPGQPSINTILSSLSIPLSSPVSDIAVVTGIEGEPIPTGTVRFEYRKGTTGEWITLSNETLTQVSPNVVTTESPTIILTTAGNWYFRAVYSGDDNYIAATTGDTAEPLTVNKATVTITTTLSTETIVLGQPIYDVATVIGLGGIFPAPTGTVTFQASQDGGLTWTTFDLGKPMSGDSATSNSYTPNKAGNGIWYFRAFYSGDDNYNSAYSSNTAEPLTVNKAPTTTTTQLSQTTITHGQSITDTATITRPNGNIPFPSGTVTFEYSTDGGITWRSFGSPKTLSSGSAISDLYTPFSAGDFNFRALYQGDSNYLSSESGPTEEPLHVNMVPGTIGTLYISSTSKSGQSPFITDSSDSVLNPYDKVNPQLSVGHETITLYSNFPMPSIITSDEISLTIFIQTTMVENVPTQPLQVDFKFTYNNQIYLIGTFNYVAIASKSNPPPLYYTDTINVAGHTFIDGFPEQVIPPGSTLSLTFTLINPQNRVDLYGGVAGTQLKLF